MKITALLLTVFCIGALANGGHTQSVTLIAKNVNLERVVAEIHYKAGYDFKCRWELPKWVKKIDIEVRNATVKNVFSISFEDILLNYIDSTIEVNMKQEESSTDISLLIKKRIVINEKGDPISCATITVTIKGNPGHRKKRELLLKTLELLVRIGILGSHLLKWLRKVRLQRRNEHTRGRKQINAPQNE